MKFSPWLGLCPPHSVAENCFLKARSLVDVDDDEQKKCESECFVDSGMAADGRSIGINGNWWVELEAESGKLSRQRKKSRLSVHGKGRRSKVKANKNNSCTKPVIIARGPRQKRILPFPLRNDGLAEQVTNGVTVTVTTSG
jgi:hypothetical protein